jgi:hypothetical protein
MAEAQAVEDGGLTSEQSAARQEILNTTDMTRFGPDTPNLIELLSNRTGAQIEIEDMSLTSLPNFGKDLGYINSVVIDKITGLLETTQTNTRDLFIGDVGAGMKRLDIGDIAYAAISLQRETPELVINFIGPITKSITMEQFPKIAATEITLTAPIVYAGMGSMEKIRIGPGCKKLTLDSIKNLKTVELDEPADLKIIHFNDVPTLEHYTPFPDTVEKTGNFFQPASTTEDPIELLVEEANHEDEIKEKIKNGSLDVNYIMYGNQLPLLSWYATMENPNMVRFLLENGANPNVPAGEFADSPGEHPVEYAVPCPECRQLIRAAGGVPSDDTGLVRDLGSRFTEPAVLDPLPELPAVEIPEIKLPFANQQVYDFEENEEVPILTLLSKMGNIIFKAKESYFTLPLEQIQIGRTDGSQIRYKCSSELHGAPLETQVDLGNPYYYVQGNGNFIVPLAELSSALTKYKVVELEQTETVLDYVASAKIVMMSPTNPVNRYGDRVNIVSADHCQAGTKQRVFKLTGIVLTSGETGGKSKAKRHVSPKRTVSKKGGTYKKKSRK